MDVDKKLINLCKKFFEGGWDMHAHYHGDDYDLDLPTDGEIRKRIVEINKSYDKK